MFATAQRSGSQGDLDSVTGEVGRVLCGSGPASDFIFVQQHMIVAGLHFKWSTLNKHHSLRVYK
jgi:hypothetical protein